MKKALLVFGLVALVGACSADRAKEELGIVKKVPNETLIQSNSKLVLPPDFDTVPVSEEVKS